MYTVKVLSGGRVRFPKPVREKYGLEKGVQIKLVDHDGVLVVVPLAGDPVDALHGMLEDGPSLTEDLLDSRSKDKEQEDKRTDRSNENKYGER
ncbi:MAG: AbrB/MazE/SpoVT family DNA-binding domain-containing protein [Anaerolineales bacterium]|nr:AbrB/MazE/SpoVT family DNA-binding domain-containing protein [Anaerolineales bacterium]